MESIITKEYRCECGKLLFRGLLLDSKIEIKCKRCQKIKIIGSVLDGLTGNKDYVLVYDQKGNLMDASKSAAAYLGYSLEELKKLSIRDINPLISTAIFERTWQLASENENYLFWEAYHQKKDGSKIFVDANINVVTVDKKEYIFFLHKINDAQEDGDETADFLELNKFVRDFVLDIDWRGQIIYSSLDILDVLGYKPMDIFSKSLFAYIPEEASDLTPAFLKKMVKNGKSFYLKKNAILKKDGKILKIESSFTPIFDEKGNTWGFSSSNWLR